MASKSKLTKPPEWWVRLRHQKRAFWKAERKNAKADAHDQAIGG